MSNAKTGTMTTLFRGEEITYYPDFLKILTYVEDDGTETPIVTARICTGVVGKNAEQGYGPVWEWSRPMDPRFGEKINMSFAWSVAENELRKLNGEAVGHSTLTIEGMVEEFRELDAELAETYREEFMADELDETTEDYLYDEEV